MKLLLTLLIFTLQTVSSYAEKGELKTGWKFISEIVMSKEEKKAEVNKVIKVIKTIDAPKKKIDEMVKDWAGDIDDEKAVYRKLSDDEIESNFSQLQGVNKHSSCSAGLTNPHIINQKYEPEIIDNNSVRSRELMCRFKADDVKGRGYLCRYISNLSYYSHKPENYFKIEGKITPIRAVEIAKSWINRKFSPNSIDNDQVPAWLSNISYNDGKYVIGYSGCGCWGSVEVKPEEVDNILHLKLISQPNLTCS